MNVLFIAPRFHTNQVGAIKALSKAGHNVRFLAVIQGHIEDYSDISPVLMPMTALSQRLQKIFDKRSDLLWPTLWGVPQLCWLRQYLTNFVPDIVIIRNPNQIPFLLSLLLIRLMRFQVIVYTQGAQHRLKRWPTRVVSIFFLDILKCAWMTPVLGNEEFPPFHQHTFYIPNVVDVCPLADQRVYAPAGLIRLLSVGKFVPRKDHLLLLEAFAKLDKSRHVHLTIVGEVSNSIHESYLKQVERKILELNLSSYVTLLTNVPFYKMTEIYLKNDAFVIPSRNERMSVSLVEAMAHGLAVISDINNGAAGYIHNNVNGFVFHAGNIEDLIDKLDRITSSASIVEYMGRQSLVLASRVHNPRNFPALLEETIKIRWQSL